VRLDDAQARAAVDGAELAVAQARVQLERARRASTDAVEQAAAGRDTAERNLALIERQLAEAESLLGLGAVAPATSRRSARSGRRRKAPCCRRARP
jgi:HlyD family secretion protein